MAAEDVKMDVKDGPKDEIGTEDETMSAPVSAKESSAESKPGFEPATSNTQVLIPGLPPPSPRPHAVQPSSAPPARNNEAPKHDVENVKVEEDARTAPGSETRTNAETRAVKSEDVTMSDATVEPPQDAMPIKADDELPSQPTYQPTSDAITHLTSEPTSLPSENASQSTFQIKSEPEDAPQTASSTEMKTEPEGRDGSFMAFDRNFIETARANRTDLEAEFAEDSDFEQDEGASDSSDSSDSDDSSDDSSDYGSVILDPAEAARMLMRAGSEEASGPSQPPRTVNEQLEKPFPIPHVNNLEETKIKELGHVSHLIPQMNCIVIRATIHAEHNVLQPGSALCLADRTLIRPISDTIAQVQEPYYISYFELDEIRQFGIEEGTPIWFVDHPEHRSFVFYEELRREKGTDASNINDEEVDDREIEFSDDEEEAAYKKAKKEEKHKRWAANHDDDEDAKPQHGRRDRGRGRGQRERGGRGGRGRGGWDQQSSYAPPPPPQLSGGLNYDDGDDDGYVKLRRPDDYTSLLSQTSTEGAPRPSSSGGTYARPPSSGGPSNYKPPDSYANPRGERRGRGDFRGRGRGDRGHRGGHRNDNGGSQRNNGSGDWQPQPVPFQPGQPAVQGSNLPPLNFVPPPPPNWVPPQATFQPNFQTQAPAQQSPEVTAILQRLQQQSVGEHFAFGSNIQQPRSQAPDYQQYGQPQYSQPQPQQQYSQGTLTTGGQSGQQAGSQGFQNGANVYQQNNNNQGGYNSGQYNQGGYNGYQNYGGNGQ